MHTCFSGRGALTCHVQLRPRAARPFPKGVTDSGPERVPPCGLHHHGVPSFALTHGVLSILPPHRRALCQALACWWHEGFKVRYCRAVMFGCVGSGSSRINPHLPEPWPCALGSSRIHSHLLGSLCDRPTFAHSVTRHSSSFSTTAWACRFAPLSPTCPDSVPVPWFGPPTTTESLLCTWWFFTPAP